MSEKRIYVVVAAAVHAEQNGIVTQVPGRQIAQACHVSSKLRYEQALPGVATITTIILQARDDKELWHVFNLLAKRKLQPTYFQDENPDVYGASTPTTAMAVYATPEKVAFILDYLPLWGSR